MIPSFESIINRIFADKRFWNTFLIGGALCFIPVLNIFAFGYLYRYLKQIYRNGNFILPAWAEWDKLFSEGLRFLLVWLLFLAAPLGLAALLGVLLTTVFSELASPAAFFIFSFSCLFSPVWFVFMLERYILSEQLLDLRPRSTDYASIKQLFGYLWIPCLAMVGAFLLSAPFYGFAVFGSHLLFISFSLVILAGIRRGIIS